MQIRRFHELAHHEFENVTLTMGNFDGVHRGHIELLARAKNSAQAHGGLSAVLTFDPHPVSLFKPGSFRLIQPLEERIEKIRSSGVDLCSVMEFTRDVADISARDFVEKILRSRFGFRELIVGFNTTFGKNRAGTPETLKSMGYQQGFAVTVVDPVMIRNEPVSSSRIRRAIQAGDITLANELLGYCYRVAGTVVKGYGRGGVLGYPTANLDLGGRLIPHSGVFAAWVTRGAQRFRGAVSIGTNPTFDNQESSLEVFLLDFEENLYGERLGLEFVTFLRDMQRFENKGELKTQLARDVEAVRHVLR